MRVSKKGILKLKTIIVGFGQADVLGLRLGQEGKSGQIDTGPSCEKHCKKREKRWPKWLHLENIFTT